MPCLNCGGNMVGDGFNMPFHCENMDCPLDVEPDSGPYFCDGKPVLRLDISRDEYGTVRIIDDKEVEVHYKSDETKLVCENLIRFHHALLEVERMLAPGDFSIEIDRVVKRALKKI